MKEKLLTIIYMEKGYTHLNKKWMFIWANGSQINFVLPYVSIFGGNSKIHNFCPLQIF